MSENVWLGVVVIGAGFALALVVPMILLKGAGALQSKRRAVIEMIPLALAAAMCGWLAASGFAKAPDLLVDWADWANVISVFSSVATPLGFCAVLLLKFREKLAVARGAAGGGPQR